MGKVYKVMFVASSGREYMVELIPTGPMSAQPKFVVWEQEDGSVLVEERRYGDLTAYAVSCGCLLGDFVSADETN